MKRLAFSLISLTLLSAPVWAEDAKKEVKEEAEKPAVATPSGKDIELVDGTKLIEENGQYFAPKADGSKGAPAKGAYTTTIGKVLNFVDGKEVPKKP